MELVMDVAVEGVVNKEVAKVVKEFNKELVKEVNEGLLLWSVVMRKDKWYTGVRPVNNTFAKRDEEERERARNIILHRSLYCQIAILAQKRKKHLFFAAETAYT